MTASLLRTMTGAATTDVLGELPPGSTVLVEGHHGVGSTEFALAFLREVGELGCKARFATALRGCASVKAEIEGLFKTPLEGTGIDLVRILPRVARSDVLHCLADRRRGDAIVFESAGALARGEVGVDLAATIVDLAATVRRAGAIMLVLHAPGTLSPETETRLREAVDSVFSFTWREDGLQRRRTLRITRTRGLAVPWTVACPVQVADAGAIANVRVGHLKATRAA